VELETLLPRWRSSLVAVGRRPRGVRRYLDQVHEFVVWLGPTSTVAQVTTERITAYQEWKAARCSPGTVGNALTSIRSFCRWMIARGLLDDDPTANIEWPKRRKGLPRPLSVAELRKLVASLAVPDDLTERQRWFWLRNRCFIFLMLFDGLRISEAAALLWKYVDLESETLTIVDGKGGKERAIPLHPVVVGNCESQQQIAAQNHRRQLLGNSTALH